jgi:hypothetical protein
MAAAARLEREAPPRSAQTTEMKRRAVSLVPQITHLEAELEKERREREQEAALMGEMLVRVSQVEHQ